MKLRSTRPFNVSGWLFIAVLLGVWELAIVGGALQFDYLPAPSAILRAAWILAASGQMLADTLHTLGVILLGWLIASVIGLALGLLLGFSPVARRYLMASVEVLRPLPGIALLPVALLLFSFSIVTELVVIVYPAIWPVLINTMKGVLAVDPTLHQVARTFRLTPFRAITRVLVPAAAPEIAVGLRLGLSLAIVMGIVAEMLGNPQGIGNAIMLLQQSMQPAAMFAYIFLVGALGIALNAGLTRVVGALLEARGPRGAAHG